MTAPITRRRDIEALKEAASWPGADLATTVTLATRLAAAGADAEGYRYFSAQAAARPGEPLPLALAGFFQARLGQDTGAALAKLDAGPAPGSACRSTSAGWPWPRCRRTGGGPSRP